MTFNLTQLLFLAGQADLLLKLWYRVCQTTMTTTLKVWRQVRDPSPSIDEEKSHQI